MAEKSALKADNTYCCVPQCKTRGTINPKASFHKFPSAEKDSRRRKLWILRLRIGKEVSNRMKVCSLHFEKKDFTLSHIPAKRPRLGGWAIPSLNLPLSCVEDESTHKGKKRKIAERKKNNDLVQVKKVESDEEPVLNFTHDDLDCVSALLALEPKVENVETDKNDVEVQVETGALSKDPLHVDHVPMAFVYNDSTSRDLAKLKTYEKNHCRKNDMGKSSRNPEHPDYVPSVFECEKDSKVSSKESYLRYLKNLGVCDYEDNSCTENEPYKSPLILRLNGTASSETDSSEETANLCKPIKEKSATTMTELSMQDIKHIEKQNIIYKSQIEFYKRLIKIKSSFSPKYSL